MVDWGKIFERTGQVVRGLGHATIINNWLQMDDQGTGGDTRELADELDALAKQITRTPGSAGYAAEISGLARVMRSPESAYAEPWTQVSLVALFDNARLVASASLPYRSLGRLLSATTRVLITLLTLCVPLELAFAFRAYGEMLKDPAPREQAVVAQYSFIRLWEDGFGKHLPTPIDLNHVTGYTLILALGLVAVTLAQVWQARAAEQAAMRFSARLVTAITRAQLTLNKRHPDSLARFTGQLSDVAQRLGAITGDVARTQQQAVEMAGQVRPLARTTVKAAKRLRASVAELGTSGEQLNATGGRIEDSLLALGTAIAGLGDEITSRIAIATDGLTAAGSDFATRIGVSSSQAARDIGDIYTEAVAAAAVHLEEKMTLVTTQVAIAVADIRTAAEQLAGSTGELTVAVSRLTETMADRAGDTR